MAIRSLCATLLLAFPVFTSAQTASNPCVSTVVGDLQIRHFQSTTFGDAQTLRIWLPSGYGDAANAQKKYSVLYMLDGENLFDACTNKFKDEWKIDETLTRLIADGAVEPIIVVGIDSPPKRRPDEYLPYQDQLYTGFPAPHGQMFPSFLADEVIPAISKEFRVTSDWRHTAIGGSSYGAFAALYALLQRPDLFGMGLLESTSLQVGNGRMLRDTASIMVGPRRVSIGVGTDELGGHEEDVRKSGFEAAEINPGAVKAAEQLAAQLKAAMMNHPQVKFVAQPGGRHDEKAWASRFPEAIKFLFPAKP